MMCCWVPDEWHCPAGLPHAETCIAIRGQSDREHEKIEETPKQKPPAKTLAPTDELNARTMLVDPFDRKMEQIFHNFIVDLDICLRLILQTGDDV